MDEPKPNKNLLHVLDEDSGDRHVVIDISGAQHRGPSEHCGGRWDCDGVPEWGYSDYLYRLSGGQFVRLRDRQHREADFPFETTVSRLSDAEAAEWLVFGGFEPPSDVAHLAVKHRFQDKLPERDRTGEKESVTENNRPTWNEKQGILSIDGNQCRAVGARATNIRKLLACFEDSEWEEHVDSPWTDDESGKQTLRETIRSLNESCEGIRFYSDGLGQGAKWQVYPQPLPF